MNAKREASMRRARNRMGRIAEIRRRFDWRGRRHDVMRMRCRLALLHAKAHLGSEEEPRICAVHLGKPGASGYLFAAFDAEQRLIGTRIEGQSWKAVT